MSQPEAVTPAFPTPAENPESKRELLHKVCIQCNNVFRVPPEKFDAKQCPNCHKG